MLVVVWNIKNPPSYQKTIVCSPPCPTSNWTRITQTQWHTNTVTVRNTKTICSPNTPMPEGVWTDNTHLEMWPSWKCYLRMDGGRTIFFVRTLVNHFVLFFESNHVEEYLVSSCSCSSTISTSLCLSLCTTFCF